MSSPGSVRLRSLWPSASEASLAVEWITGWTSSVCRPLCTSPEHIKHEDLELVQESHRVWTQGHCTSLMSAVACLACCMSSVSGSVAYSESLACCFPDALYFTWTKHSSFTDERISKHTWSGTCDLKRSQESKDAGVILTRSSQMNWRPWPTLGLIMSKRRYFNQIPKCFSSAETHLSANIF